MSYKMKEFIYDIGNKPLSDKVWLNDVSLSDFEISKEV